MGVPRIAIVGRPNVGKSSLFNWLVGRRLAIVDPTAGVTRDRMTHLVQINDRYVELIDTGGMGIEDSDHLTREVEEQIQVAIEMADLILFVVDTRDGISALDELVARRLQTLDIPVLCVANKTDHDGLTHDANEFYRFGRKIIPISVQQNRGKPALLSAIEDRLPPKTDENANPEEEMKIAIVGRRNVGKSTFINTLAEEMRMIVSDVPGTTRDSVDVRFLIDNKPFVAIDTPGLRRRKSINTNIDFYGTHRAERSIRRADVVLLFFDCTQRISKIEKQLCDYIANEFKPCIFVVNKWDMIPAGVPFERWVRYLRNTFRTMQHVPIAFITGQTGKNVRRLLNHAQLLFKQSQMRVPTSELNRLVRAALEHNPPPMRQNRRPKVYYGTQVGVQPPTIALFCNNPTLIDNTYRRYLLSILRDYLPFDEIPIKMYLRARESSDSTNEIDKKIAPTEQGKPLSYLEQLREEMLKNYQADLELLEVDDDDNDNVFLDDKGNPVTGSAVPSRDSFDDSGDSHVFQTHSKTVFRGERIDPDNLENFDSKDAIDSDEYDDEFDN